MTSKTSTSKTKASTSKTKASTSKTSKTKASTSKTKASTSKAKASTSKAKASTRLFGGVQVNPTIPIPRSPGPWVDEERNAITGQTYDDFRSTCTFGDGVAMVRRAAKRAGDAGGGYRSVGPVKHALRVCKLDQWYQKAMDDEGLWNHAARRPYNARELEKMEAAAKRAEAKRPARGKTKGRRVLPYRPDPEYGF